MKRLLFYLNAMQYDIIAKKNRGERAYLPLEECQKSFPHSQFYLTTSNYLFYVDYVKIQTSGLNKILVVDILEKFCIQPLF